MLISAGAIVHEVRFAAEEEDAAAAAAAAEKLDADADEAAGSVAVLQWLLSSLALLLAENSRTAVEGDSRRLAAPATCE